MRAVELQILLALAAAPKHGYAIKRDVETRSAGAIHLGPGTLYEATHRLRQGGLGQLEEETVLAGDALEVLQQFLLDAAFGAGADAVDQAQQ